MNTSSEHFHLIGIGGIGMSAIAKILLQKGCTVSGCDSNADPRHTAELLSLGCMIAPHHQHIICSNPSITTIVHTTAVQQNHPELIEARQKNKQIFHRANILAKLMQTYSNPIAIAGSHGKTSTTALLSHIFMETNQDPTIVIGGHSNSLQSNAHTGKSDIFIAEADESDKSFLQLPKRWSIVTNIDLEHLETYQNIDEVKESFIQFINSTQQSGGSVVCIDNEYVKTILPQLQTKLITYGTSQKAAIQISNINLQADFSTFQLFDNQNQQTLGPIHLPIAGIHQIYNATAAITLALQHNISFKDIQKSLLSFAGVDRRFTFKGITKQHQIEIFDDYGHHPEEIRHTLQVARKKTKNELIVLFQPHRFSRTKHLWHEFIDVFTTQPIDKLFIADIYPASEAPLEDITSERLVDEIRKKKPDLSVFYSPINENYQKILQLLEPELSSQSLLILLGAGKIHTVSHKLLS